MAKKIRIDVSELKEEKANIDKTKKYKYFNIFLVVLIIVLIVVLVISLTDEKKDTFKVTDTDSKISDTKEKKEDYPLHHFVTCTNSKNNFQGYPFSYEFEYSDNDLIKYSFAFYLDQGKELSEDVLWNYVSKYEGKMPWHPDEKGFGLADDNNPYKYRIYYSLTSENYCENLDGCDEVQLEFSHAKEMVVDFEDQLDVKCTIQ